MARLWSGVPWMVRSVDRLCGPSGSWLCIGMRPMTSNEPLWLKRGLSPVRKRHCPSRVAPTTDETKKGNSMDGDGVIIGVDLHKASNTIAVLERPPVSDERR